MVQVPVNILSPSYLQNGCGPNCPNTPTPLTSELTNTDQAVTISASFTRSSEKSSLRKRLTYPKKRTNPDERFLTTEFPMPYVN